MAMEPIVNGLQRDNPDLPIIKIDVNSRLGKEAARRWEVRLVPTFIAVSSDGRQLLRAEGFQPRSNLEYMAQLCRAQGGHQSGG